MKIVRGIAYEMGIGNLISRRIAWISVRGRKGPGLRSVLEITGPSAVGEI